MTGVPDEVERLASVLRAEEGLYLRMRALLQREEAELIELDPNVIHQTVEAKRALAEEGRLLEESRQVLAGELAIRLGFGESAPKLSKLIAALGDQAGELPALHARLTALIGSARSLLDGNQSFANRSLARVQDTLRLLGRSVPEEVGYGPGGQGPSSTGRGRLVRQAI